MTVGRLTVFLLLAAACNVQIVEPESIAGELPVETLDTLPQRPFHEEQGDPSTVWAAAIRRNLNFLTDPALAGRRPGTDGAELTQSAIISVFGDAGLIPSAPAMGWTAPVGVRTVQLTTPKLTVTLPGEGDQPTQFEITEGLWLHHRGAAGTFHLPMEAVRLGPQTLIADRLAIGTVPVLDVAEETGVAASTRLRGFLDAVAHRSPGGCLLALPAEKDVGLRAAAQVWSNVEVQERPLGSEPPAGLPIEGFVDATAFELLGRAADTPGSKVDVSFVAEERWFEDGTVVGRIAGRRKPEQVVLVTANWDAGGLSEPLPEGGSAQAASGIAVLLALVERVSLLQEAGRAPTRSIVFVAGAAGSLGNLGLSELAKREIALPENIVAVVHLQDLDWTAPTLTVVGGTRSTIGERVRELLPLANLTDHKAGFGHEAFEGLSRVPRVTLTREGGVKPENLDPATPLTNVANTARVAFDLAWELADASETPLIILPRIDAGVTDPAELAPPVPTPAPTE